VLLAGISGRAQNLDMEQGTFLQLINSYRAQNGTAPLRLSPTLANSSQMDEQRYGLKELL